MRSPLSALAVIACPHCGTRYRVPLETLGPTGREVQCAQCGRSWQAAAQGGSEPVHDNSAADQLFDAATEQDLDAAFAAEEAAAAAEAAEAAVAAAAAAPPPAAEPASPPPEPDWAAPVSPPTGAEQQADAKARKTRTAAFLKRQSSLAARLPLARVRRTARLVSVGSLLALVTGGIAFRTEIVRALPDLAGAYAAVGLPVNVVGLEFRNVQTLLALRSGADVIQVDGRIHSISPRSVLVPPVVVELLDGNGTTIYEWSVSPQAADLEPGEVVDFATQLNSPPAEAARVRLTFSNRRAKSETQTASAVQPSEPAH